MASVIVTGSLVVTGSTFVGAGIVTDGLDYYLDPGNLISLPNQSFTSTTSINNLAIGGYSSSGLFVPWSGSIFSSSTVLTEFNPNYGGCLDVVASGGPAILNQVNTMDTNYFRGKPAVTLSIWVYINNYTPLSNRYGNLFNCGYSTGTGTPDKKIVSYLAGSTNISHTTAFYTTGTALSPTSPAMDKGKWNYITLIFNQGTAISYSNGVPGTQVVGGGLTLRTNLTSPTIRNFRIGGGGNFGPNADTYSGSMGPVQIYGRALTQQEVLQNYHTMKGRFGIYN
jgi:hypothetical protein